MTKFLLTLICLVSTFIVSSQKQFEGVITYAINYQDVPKKMASIKEHLPTELKVSYKGNKKREETQSKYGDKVTIIDMSDKTGFMLMTIFGKKIAIVHDEETQKDYEVYDNGRLEYLEETKKIGKYNCKKARLYLKGFSQPVTVYYTEKFITPERKFNQIKGMPLAYTITEDDMIITYMIKALEEKGITDEQFVINENYRIMTTAQLQEEFGITQQ